MPFVEQDFDLSLLAEADLAEDPYPDQSLKLDVVCRDETAEGSRLERLSIRTTPRQFNALIDQYRALRYTLIQRAKAQAERDAEAAPREPELESPVDQARRRALEEERAGRPAVDNPLVHMELLERLRLGLEDRLGPVPRDSPPGEIEP